MALVEMRPACSSNWHPVTSVHCPTEAIRIAQSVFTDETRRPDVRVTVLDYQTGEKVILYGDTAV